ncbi:FAD protein [Venustampulla echinocandica]|uniref:FAD protein n=1 Tax=Venustampulla echinocandica TaxID=2656787 RepID=A0A370TWZ6_9HELO|nr:FAD protein [Venustampulla echinocandica]RDL40056.1 FAD protein [Venustampulla echinocandica]
MAARPKTVCVIGAGPSGLVAAKTLVHDHPKDTFHVTVFEALDRIGGLWPVSENGNGMINPDMCTNQSRHTMSFSGLAWPADAHSFPKAWQVGQYLERYIEKYPGYEIRKNCRVVKARLHNGKWEINTRKQSNSKSNIEGADEIHEFDHVIISSGFFGTAKIPKILEGIPAPIFHSSQVRDVKGLLTDNGKRALPAGRNIVVVGGQMSGVEIGASIAFQLSSAENLPGESDIPNAAEYVITHVVQRPVWVMPLFFPKNPILENPNSQGEKASNPSPYFLPVDLVTYNIGWRPPGPLQNSSGHISSEAAKITHGFMNTYIGTDQSDLGTPHLEMQGDVRSDTPWLSVSDGYCEYVRSGKIRTVQGKVVRGQGSDGDVIVLQNDGIESSIEGVAAVVFATGYEACPSLDFLPEDILETLQFEPTSDAFPLALNVHSTINKEIPSLGFVGFYRSPYWGIMEMQARYLGRLWSGDSKAAKAMNEDTTLESMVKLRNDPLCAQFPMGDYAYLMESFSDILDIKRAEPEGSTGRTGLVLPHRYLPNTASETEREEASTALRIVDQAIEDSTERAKFVAKAAFRAMQGDWKLERTIASRIDSYPSGTLSGNAYFKPRLPTERGYDLEYLYLESGEFNATNGFKFQAKRSYAHRYNSATDTLSVWFTKPDHKTVDYLFHELEFVPPPAQPRQANQPWNAKSSHLCIQDLYDVAYKFYFQGAQLREWSLEYSVKGPAKDYSIRSVYRR